MRDERLTDKLEIRRLDAICARQSMAIELMGIAMADVIGAYKRGELGHRQIGEMASVLEENAGHKMMALLSRLLSLRKAVEKFLVDGKEDDLRMAHEDAAVALSEGFYE